VKEVKDLSLIEGRRSCYTSPKINAEKGREKERGAKKGSEVLASGERGAREGA